MTSRHVLGTAVRTRTLPVIALTAFLAALAPAGVSASTGTAARDQAGPVTAAPAAPQARCWPKIKCGDSCCVIA
ncbi:hypothetical protein ACRYCC_20615 [Actinomadura scrupuli]|uniref:hypothetical protein n=1 Tax=Actinomadura scrupuli TaxID=559629 RepID=UPI003D95B028